METLTISLRHRVSAGLAAAAMGFVSASTLAVAQAPMTHYLDVEAGVWYEESAKALLDSGALDSSESRLRPNALATRAEVMKLLVNVSGRSMITPAIPSFNDVSKSAWYYSYVETSADAGWVRGDGNCYRTSRPCTARPGDGVNRAEMAALLQRAFALSYDNTAPVFPDVSISAWYFMPIQTAADHCILQGDDRTGNVRPGAFMNRAEMVVMFHRASENQEYGRDCGVSPPLPAAEIRSTVATTLRRVRVMFSADLETSIADDAPRYMVVRSSGGGEIDVTDAIVINARTVELHLRNDLIENVTYRLTATNLRTEAGRTFSDSDTFVFPDPTPVIMDVSVRSATQLRARFNVELDSARADDAFRFTVERAGGGGAINVDRATVLDDRTIDLELGSSLTSQVTYVLTATDLQTDAGLTFTDSASFRMDEPVPDLTSASAESATRVQLTFNVDLDETAAEIRTRYRITGEDGDISIGRVTLTTDNSVELTLDEALQGQQLYTVTVTDLRTTAGVSFSDTGSFVYAPTEVRFQASLLGIREIPPVVTNASGTGTFVLTATGLQYDITLRTISGSLITGAHFHTGAPGIEGGVIETINFNGGLRATGTWEGLTAEERDLLLDGNIYVNVHTQAYPDGEIRGQVIAQ